MKIGIVGNGFVGRATALLAPSETVTIYDKNPELCSPSGCELNSLLGCDLVFVCVPTPMNEDGSCHTGIVESLIKELMLLGYPATKTIIRSTVPAGTSKRLGVMFMPEFLTEKNWKEDTYQLEDWVIGFDSREARSSADKVYDLLLSAHDKGVIKNKPLLSYVGTASAELSKYGRNSFLAMKVSFFCELKELCDKKNIEFEEVRKLICLDKRINKSHSLVPGPDGRAGYGGTCLPKDVSALFDQMCSCGMESYIIEAVKARNIQVDRPEKDWENDKGRAVV